MLTEQEVVAAALAEHGPEQAEKFVQEVIWRSYFKGWLERRPGIWSSYRSGLHSDRQSVDADPRLMEQFESAQSGTTGLTCFDAWMTELRDTGYLHNHARMWFASIWIFTFQLPWRLGADLFYRHLLDGDPASNTLSWRWVAGLHTRGKVYQAQAWNIAKFTAGRFAPNESDLASDVVGLDQIEEPQGLPEAAPLRKCVPPKPGQPTALLITEEDCLLEDFDLAGLDIRTAARLRTSHLRSDQPVSGRVIAFEDAALADTAQRCGVDAPQMDADDPAALAEWAASNGAVQIATPYAPTGPLRDMLEQAAPALASHGIILSEWQRDWDRQIWPYATAGFFKVKKRIPHLLQDLGLT
ncbi:MAG: FAD-binding domain-containing protein [Roseovarius sp.]